MNHEARIISAMELGEIKKVVMIDDAFDAPVLGNEDAGPLLEFLEDQASGPTLKKAKISDDEVAGAIEAITNTDYVDEQLQAVISKLYGQFVEKFNSRFDPSGRFTIVKGDNLRRVRPLLRLLSKCKGMAITRIGTSIDAIDLARLKPDAIFIDYYLDGSLSAADPVDREKEGNARQDSLRMLRRVLSDAPGTSPSVVLMSSHSVRKEAGNFRKEINDGWNRLFASRFQYISKDDLEEEEDGSISVKGVAAEALLDIAQCHKFAGAVEEALSIWREGADKAVKEVWETITNLELKDYAYLARFRLAEEGQPLSSYLEWFLGEVLVDSIARSVKWNHGSFVTLDAAASGKNPGSQIEGTFDGPTHAIAELYFRARIDSRPGRQGTDMRTGDLYMHDASANEILAITTPECDLVLRGNKRKAKRMMAVAGTVQPINAPDSSIADYIQLGKKKPANVVWNAKDIRTIEYEDVGEGGHKLVGTLRPLYAHELQRRVLADLGRVGLAVAPALGMTATVSVVVAKADGTALAIALPSPSTSSCIVIPKRDSADKPRIVYRRSFVPELLGKLFALAEGALSEEGRAQLNVLNQPRMQQQLHTKLCLDGQLDGESAFGMVSSLQPQKTKGQVPWCQILVAHNAIDERPEDIAVAEQ